MNMRSPSFSGGMNSLPIRGTSATAPATTSSATPRRSEEHTSELQSRLHLVCRLLLEKKKKKLSRATGPNKQAKNSTILVIAPTHESNTIFTPSNSRSSQMSLVHSRKTPLTHSH